MQSCRQTCATATHRREEVVGNDEPHERDHEKKRKNPFTSQSDRQVRTTYTSRWTIHHNYHLHMHTRRYINKPCSQHRASPQFAVLLAHCTPGRGVAIHAIHRRRPAGIRVGWEGARIRDRVCVNSEVSRFESSDVGQH